MAGDPFDDEDHDDGDDTDGLDEDERCGECADYGDYQCSVHGPAVIEAMREQDEDAYWDEVCERLRQLPPDEAKHRLSTLLAARKDPTR